MDIRNENKEKGHEPLDIPEVSTNFPLLHHRMRKELDPSSALISDDELMQIIKTVGSIPYRAITRCLMVLERRARKKQDIAAIKNVRNLKMRFSDGLLKLNAERFSSRC